MDDEEREVSIVETEDVEDTLQETIGTFARKQMCLEIALYILLLHIYFISYWYCQKKKTKPILIYIDVETQLTCKLI